MSKIKNPTLTGRAQTLRKEMTKEEKHLWYDFLKNLPKNFNRQKVFDPYILDFYCAEEKIAIELDGSQHYEPTGRETDRVRDAFLREKGIFVLRYTNYQINHEFPSVCADILKHLH